MTVAHALFGHRIASPRQLWGLASDDGLSSDAPTLTLAMDSMFVSRPEEFGTHSVPFHDSNGAGRLSFVRGEANRFSIFVNERHQACARVDHDLVGGTIHVSEDRAIDPVAVASFLVSPFMPLRLRTTLRFFPLHAAVVAMGEQAVAICGASGAGKTTLALHLREQAHAIIADDLAAIDPASGMVHHGAAFSRLDPGHPAARDETSTTHRNSRLPKHLLDTGDHDFWVRPRALPLSAIFLLGALREGAQTSVQRVTHPRAGIALYQNLSGEMFGPLQAARQAGLTAALAVATRIPVYTVRRPRGLEHLGAVADVIRRTVGVR